MGKNYCKIESKWCKFLKRGVCQCANASLDCVNRCPRLIEIETRRLADVLKEVDFEKTFNRLTYWFKNQESSKTGYKDVFDKLLTMKPNKHNLSDLFIEVNKVFEDDGECWLNVHGIMPKSPQKGYAIEFTPWNDWISMFIDQKTLDSLSKEEIVAACMYEMTFFGFEEEDVQDSHNDLINRYEECIKDIKGKV